MGTRIKQVKDFGARQAARLITEMLPRISDEKLSALVRLGLWLSNDPEIVDGTRKVLKLLETPDHPAKELFRRVLLYLSPRQRVKLFDTLFNHAFFQGGKRRDYVEAHDGFRPPFIMILSPTYHCNLRCKGCYTLGYGTRPELPYEVVDRVLDECEMMGIYFVTVLGGEPLTYPHLFRMLEAHPNIFFQVYSNGTLMTKEKAKRFADCGNAAVVLSIEGGEKETDSWRGKGVYKKIMNAFDYLREARVLIGSSATVTRQNVMTVSSEAFIDKMISMGSVAQMYFLYIPVNGMADFSLMVTPEQRNHLRKRVIETRNTKPLFVLDFWNDGPYVQGCIAGGRRYFHINAKGDVEPCVYTHIAVDNIMHKSLKEVLNSPLFRSIRRRQPHNPNHLRPCMIIDNPHVLREVIAENHPYFTHPGAEEIFTTKSKQMDEYAARWGKLADKVWRNEYNPDGMRKDNQFEIEESQKELGEDTQEYVSQCGMIGA